MKHERNQQESPNGQIVILSAALSSDEMTRRRMLQITPQITFKPLARISDHKKDKVLAGMFFGREQITHILYDPEALLSHSLFSDFMCKKKQKHCSLYE